MAPLLPDLPVVYTADRRGFRGFTLFMLGLSVVLWWVMSTRFPMGRWLVLAFGVFVTAALWWGSNPQRYFLELERDGFRIASGSRNLFVHWKDVRYFTTVTLFNHPTVVWYYTEEFKRSELMPAGTNPMDGSDGSMDSYGNDPDELAQVLNDLLAAYGNPGRRDS